MTPEQIREIVNMTIDELTDRKLIRSDSYQYILSVVDKQLYSFFNGSDGDVTKIYHALTQVSDDDYIDIIYLQYRDNITLERIAEYFKVDVSTIKRNKKRLIKVIYEIIKEG